MAISAGVDDFVIKVSRLVPVPGPQAHAGGPVDLANAKDPMTF